MCVGCAKYLLDRLTDVSRLQIGGPCPTEECSGLLISGYDCLVYRTEVVTRGAEPGVRVSQDRAKTYTDRCTEVQQLKQGAGFPSPCDRCVYSGEFKSWTQTLICPVCGFYSSPGVSWGYAERYASLERGILHRHYPPFLDALVSKSLRVAAGEVSVDQLDGSEIAGLQSLGILLENQLSPHAAVALRKLLTARERSDDWFSEMWKDRLQFIRINGRWRSSNLIRENKEQHATPRILIDADALRECLSEAALAEVHTLALDPNISPVDLRAVLSRPTPARAAMFSVMRGIRVCISNQLLEVELLEGLLTQNSRAERPEQYESVWSDLTGRIRTYEIDHATLGVAGALVRVYVEIMRGHKEPDVKDVYHYVFAIQHRAELILTGDRFLLSVPEFLDRVEQTGLEQVVDAAVRSYSRLYPRFATIYGVACLREGFTALLSERLMFIDRNSALSDGMLHQLVDDIIPGATS